MGFRFLDHTADLAVEVTAPSREALFGEALAALAAALVDPAALVPVGRRRLIAEAPDPALLLADLLNEALGRFEISGELYTGAEVELREVPGGFEIAVDAPFDRFDPGRHEVRVPVKGVTYHGLEIGRRGDLWRATLIFDL